MIDVSSNWSTFGPVEKLEWRFWNHRRSYVRYKNRFNWIGEQLEQGADEKFTFSAKTNFQWSSLFAYLQKNQYSDEGCPSCGSVTAIDICKEQKLIIH